MSDDASKPAPNEELVRSLWQEVRDLIKRLEGSTVQRIAVQAGDYRFEIERGAVTAATGGPPPPQLQTEIAPVEIDTRHPIMAPLVGTFYRSPQPGAKAFVEEGDVVDAGQTLCIVEAMKIMNQVQADRGGRVSEILVKDGEWVEYQQVLLYLDEL